MNFQALKAWNGTNIVFLHKIKLLFCYLIEKIKALMWGYFKIFHEFIDHLI
jgi:hypothetical protein